MATTSTGVTILQRMAEIVFEGEGDITTTATGGSSTTWVDSGFNSPHTSARAYDGATIHFTTDVSPSPDEFPDLDQRITNWDSSTGTFTVANWSTDPASGDLGHIYYGLTATDMKLAYQDTLRNLKLPAITPLSLGEDAGMNDSGESAYTAVNGATLTKVTTPHVFTGTQALQIATNAAAEGAATENISFTGTFMDAFVGEPITVSVIVYNSLGAWTVNLTDESDNVIRSVAIASTSTARHLEIRFQDAIESSDVGMKVSILNTSGGATDIIVWDSHSILSQTREVYQLPTEVEDASDVEAVLYLPQGRATEASDIFQPLSIPFQEWPKGDNYRDYKAVHSHRIALGQRPSTRPLWLQYKAPAGALSTIDATTDAPIELVAQGAAARALEKLSARTTDRDLKAESRGRAQVAWNRYHYLLKDLELDESEHKSAQRRVSVV